jgi:type II secretory pathway component PulM
MTTMQAPSRERGFFIGGMLVLALSLLVTYVDTYGVLPAVTRWREREVQLDRVRAQVAQLKGLQRQASELEAAASSTEALLAGGARRVIHARSSALGASALQTLLQGAADASGLVVDRVDQPGQEVGEGFADAGAGFKKERGVGLEDGRDGARHRLLLGAMFE